MNPVVLGVTRSCHPMSILHMNRTPDMRCVKSLVSAQWEVFSLWTLWQRNNYQLPLQIKIPAMLAHSLNCHSSTLQFELLFVFLCFCMHVCVKNNSWVKHIFQTGPYIMTTYVYKKIITNQRACWRERFAHSGLDGIILWPQYRNIEPVIQ
jgi:hypothetical protein